MKATIFFFNSILNTSGGSVVKNPPANAGDLDSILVLGRSPGEGSGNPLQHSSLGNPWAEEPGGLQSRGCKELDTTEQLNSNKLIPLSSFSHNVSFSFL